MLSFLSVSKNPDKEGLGSRKPQNDPQTNKGPFSLSQLSFSLIISLLELLN